MSAAASFAIASARRAVFAALNTAPHGVEADRLAAIFIAATDAAQQLKAPAHARIDALMRALAFEIDCLSPDTAAGDRAGRAALDAALLLARGHLGVLRIARAEEARRAAEQPQPEHKDQPSA